MTLGTLFQLLQHIRSIVRGIVVVVVDSHIQRIVLATEETTVTQQVGSALICCISIDRAT